jgi:hypothetical protein
MLLCRVLSCVRASLVLATALIASDAAFADAREQAQRIHDRIAGVPPDAATLTTMEGLVNGGDLVSAALLATQNRHFYTVTLKNFAAPWTNRDQAVFVPLNDYTTLVIGMVKEDVPFNQILSADMLYVDAQQALPTADSNQHYVTLEARMTDPAFDPDDIMQTTQSAVYGTPSEATAGAMTTRAASEAFFIAGTNRAMFRFTLVNHMCVDMEQVQDTSIIPDRIRQDVSRSPGADSRVFLNNCIGCHAGMDPMAQAFAYYDFDETLQRLVYTAGAVQPKYFNNDETFADGFVTPDNSWSNYWREGQNALLGWGAGGGSGAGAKSLGQELAGSTAFAQCQVRKVFRAVCLREPDSTQVDTLTASFRGNNFNLRRVFAESATYCEGP